MLDNIAEKEREEKMRNREIRYFSRVPYRFLLINWKEYV